MTLPCFVLTSFVAAPRGEANPAGDVHFKKGLQLSLQKKWPQAEAAYRKAIALDPKNATYRSYLADALAAQGKFDKAQDSYQQSDQIKKANPQSSYKKPAPRTAKNNRKPTTNRTPAMNRTSSTPPPTYKPAPQRDGTGTISRSSGSRTSGTRGSAKIPVPPIGDDDAGKGNDTDDNNANNNGTVLPPAVFTLPDGRTVTVTGRPGETITIPPTDDHDPDSTDGDKPDILNDPHYIKAQEYADDEKWAQAEIEYRAALKTFPNAVEGWDALGDVYFKQGNWAKAEQAHRAAVRLMPDDGYFHAQLAYDLLKQGRRAEADTEAKAAIRLGLEDHEVFDELGLHVNVAD